MATTSTPFTPKLPLTQKANHTMPAPDLTKTPITNANYGKLVRAIVSAFPGRDNHDNRMAAYTAIYTLYRIAG